MHLAQLAQTSAEEASTFGWYVGFAIAFAIIVVVVVIVASILALAERIGRQALAATDALNAARISTLPLWDLHWTNDAAQGILDDLEAARTVLAEAYSQ